MKRDHDNTLLDGLLEEALGGVAPPDLSSRILEAWSRQQTGTQAGPPLSVYAEASADYHEPEPPPLVLSDVLHPVRDVSGSRSRRTQKAWPVPLYSSLAAAAAVLLLSYFGVRFDNIEGGKSQAVKQPKRSSKPVKPGSNRVADTQLATTPEKRTTPETSGDRSSPAKSNNEDTPAIVKSNNNLPERSPVVEPSASDGEVITFINRELREGWSQHDITPSAEATDAEWCRRVFLRIVGRIPKVEELESFTKQESTDKREQLVDRLLSDSSYLQEYAQHWSDVWTNVLVGRALDGESLLIGSREGLQQYLRESLLANKPYDRLALELLSATGSGQPGADSFNGAANFLLAHATDDGTVATARVCSVFLGVQLQCTQCHDHPTAPLKQHTFWSMNAFFRQMKVIGNSNDPRELIDQDFLGHDGRDEEGMVIYEAPNGLVKAARPIFLDGKEIPRSGRVSEVNRREQLARLVVKTDNFAKAAVNRIWSHFLGYGFTRPVDDMSAENATSHPELFEGFAGEFAAHGHDLKKAIRWIALSDAFNRSSKVAGSQLADMPEAGTLALFGRYYTRQLPAEEVTRSLQIAASLRRDTASGGIEQARLAWLAQARKTSGDEGIISPELIQSSPLVRRATTNGLDTMLHTVSTSKLPFDRKVEHLFLAALSRRPNGHELALAKSMAGVNEQNVAAALEDVWWALLNSNEFALDH